MSINDIERARLLEHAVESAVGGLSREEWLELRRQVGTAALDQDDSLERAAAASFVAAVGLVLLNRPASSPEVRPLVAMDVADLADLAAQRRALASQRFMLQRNWAPAGDPAGREVTVDVVWDARTQSGYMRFVGLRRNDPSGEQYQLWIFDGRRDDRYPIDGGVFDVRTDGEDVIVPIRVGLPVGSPRAFAVTIERPGGVVVSDRSRVVVIARVG